MGDGRRDKPRWMQRLVIAELVMATLAGCGSDGEDGLPGTAHNARDDDPHGPNHFILTVDEFGLQPASLLYSVSTPYYVRLDTALGAATADGWHLKPVTMIYIDRPQAVESGVSYSLDPAGANPFPGMIVFFNGDEATLRRAVAGSMILAEWGTTFGATVSGRFDLIMVDGAEQPAPTAYYRMAGEFSYVLGSESTLAVPPVAGRSVQ